VGPSLRRAGRGEKGLAGRACLVRFLSCFAVAGLGGLPLGFPETPGWKRNFGGGTRPLRPEAPGILSRRMPCSGLEMACSGSVAASPSSAWTSLTGPILPVSPPQTGPIGGPVCLSTRFLLWKSAYILTLPGFEPEFEP
jgi:hypothetical protein